MKLQEIKNIYRKELSELVPKEEIDSFFYLAIEHHLSLERFVLVLQPNLNVDKAEEKLLFEILHRLKKQEPIQYILGESYFAGLRFKVNESVLIPRPETEELVHWVCNDHLAIDSGTTILDIGTGSGCIGISLAKLLPESKVYAIDVSEEALQVAAENAKINMVDVDFRLADIRHLDSMGKEIDIIVSNPPYVRMSEKDQMQDNVIQYEPHTALFVPDEDPMLYYQDIARFAQENLNKYGEIYLEVNQYLAEDALKLFDEEKFSEIELRKDLFGKNRMLKVSGKS